MLVGSKEALHHSKGWLEALRSGREEKQRDGRSSVERVVVKKRSYEVPIYLWTQSTNYDVDCRYDIPR